MKFQGLVALFAVMYLWALVGCVADGLISKIVNVIEASWPVPYVRATESHRSRVQGVMC